MRHGNLISPFELQRPHEGNEIYRVVILEDVLPGKEGKGNPVWSDPPTDSSVEKKNTFPPIDVDNPDRTISIYDADDCNCLLVEELAWVRYDADIGRFVPIGSQGLTRHAIAYADIAADTTGDFKISKENTLLSPDVLIEAKTSAAQPAKADQQYLVHYFIGEKALVTGAVNRAGQWRVIDTSTQTVKIGKADYDISADSSGTVSIWRAGVDTTEDITDVKLDWMHGGQKVSAGKEVLIQWFADESIWRITGAECE